MKHRMSFLSLISSFVFSSYVIPMSAQTAKIGVISDLHYAHPALIVEKGKALDNYLSHDRKLLVESHAILQQTIQCLLRENVNIVLIPGDLTKDGEKVSHRGVAHLLQPLLDKGVKVLIVPGNHDINNPKAVSFHGDSILPVETVSAEDFEQIYKDYGFRTAISRDKHSLSYVSEPIDGFRVICIDACKYDDNTFISRGAEKDICVTGGTIKPGTMDWIRTEMQVAGILGKQVIGMIHHNVVEHFDHQGVFAAPYMVDDFKRVQAKFLDFGLNVLFTGHFHSSDIVRIDDVDGNYLYEIETGSLVTYPCPYRMIDLAGNSINIETKYIEEIDFQLPEGMNFQVYARKQIEVGFNEMLPGFIHEYHHTFHEYIPKWAKSFVTVPDASELIGLLMARLSPTAINMLLAHYSGNENAVENAEEHKQELLVNLDNLIDDLAKAFTGRFSGIAGKFIHRSDIMKKAKVAVASIWDNMIVEPGDASGIYIPQPVNDLHLALNMKMPSDRMAKYTAPFPSREPVYIAGHRGMKDSLVYREQPLSAVLDRKRKYITD